MHIGRKQRRATTRSGYARSRSGQTLAEYALILALLGSGVLYASVKLLASVHAQLAGGVVVEMGRQQSGADILKKK